MGFRVGGGKKALKPETLHLKAEAEGAGVGSDPSNSPSPWAARHRPGAGASSPLQTRAGDGSLRPAGQGSPGNALKGQGPEHASHSAWGRRSGDLAWNRRRGRSTVLGTPVVIPSNGKSRRSSPESQPVDYPACTASSTALKSTFLVCDEDTHPPDS